VHFLRKSFQKTTRGQNQREKELSQDYTGGWEITLASGLDLTQAISVRLSEINKPSG
jgi:hypothetical protein